MVWHGEDSSSADKGISQMELATVAELLRSRVMPTRSSCDNQPVAIRLAIVDRFLVVRQGVRRMLAAVPDIIVVAEADSAEGIMDVLLSRSVDVLLIDPEHGLPSAQNILEVIKCRTPELNIVMFAATCRDSDIDFAVQIGVAGYIMKSTQTGGLVNAIRRAANKSTCFCDEATKRLASYDARRNQGYPMSRLATLTGRETNVLRLLSKGLATKVIALELHLSAKTVDNHRSRIMTKLNIHNRVELCRFAVREGIITA